MTISEIRKMQLGQVVDFCISYNNRHKDETADPAAGTGKKKKKPAKKYRKATQDEIRAYFG